VLLAAARSGSPLEPQALLSGIARNLVLRWRGRMSQRLRADGEWWTETSEDAPMPDAEEQIRAAERAAVVHEAIRGLPDIFREVFVRCEVDGADMSEVAREIGIPVNTGYNRLRLARAHFREAVKRILARWRLASGDL
jgi:DNA-directed RNA polymerase specialized sigma24 family protein